MSLRPGHPTEALRRETAADVERFLDGGGKIERVPDGVSGLDARGNSRSKVRKGRVHIDVGLRRGGR